MFTVYIDNPAYTTRDHMALAISEVPADWHELNDTIMQPSIVLSLRN